MVTSNIAKKIASTTWIMRFFSVSDDKAGQNLWEESCINPKRPPFIMGMSNGVKGALVFLLGFLIIRGVLLDWFAPGSQVTLVINVLVVLATIYGGVQGYRMNEGHSE